MNWYSKKQVAKSQLEEAIKQFFEGRDPVSIHTLIGASHQIMRDLASFDKLDYHCIIESLSLLNSYCKKEWHKAVFMPRNFFKHADNDADAVLDFDPSENEVWLLDSCILYSQIFRELSKPVEAFLSWYQIKYPESKKILNPPPLIAIAGLMKIGPDEFSFFRDHCD